MNFIDLRHLRSTPSPIWMFAIPFLSPRNRGLRPRWWLRLAAISGFVMTLLYVVLSIFPIVDVESSWAYSLKIIVVVLGANTLGWAIYRAGTTKGSPRPG